MTDGPIQIRNEDVVRDVRELAALSGKPITEVVARAVRAELAKARRIHLRDDRRQAVRDAVERFRNLPKIGPLLTDADLYDEDGLPR